MKPTPWRGIPAVEKVLQALGEVDLPRAVVVRHVRSALAAFRGQETIPSHPQIVGQLRASLARLRHSRLQPVINATGVLIHTNLGRAPLAASAVSALTAAAGYCNLEMDLATGERGPRGVYLEQSLALLCGAESATVVNNCAAALILILRCFARPPRDEVLTRLEEMGISDPDKIYQTDDLAPGKKIIFAATGVTDGALLKGVRLFGAGKRTHSLVMTTEARHIRFIDTVHVEGGPDTVIRF